MATYKAWGIVSKGDRVITIEVQASSKREAKEKMTSNGEVLTSEIYKA